MVCGVSPHTAIGENYAMQWVVEAFTRTDGKCTFVLVWQLLGGGACDHARVYNLCLRAEQRVAHEWRQGLHASNEG